MRILSFGGGVQSTALAILAAQGKIAVDAVVFVDTGFEQSIVFDFLNNYTLPMLDKSNIQFYIAKTQDYAASFGDVKMPPFFANNKGTEGRTPAFCSHKWKREVFNRFCNEKFGAKSYDVLFGFSTDEIHRAARMKPSKKWKPVFPLLDLQMRRSDCIALVLREFDAEPPRSSCWFCPNHKQDEWAKIMQSDDREKVIEYDEQILKPLGFYLTAEYKRITECNFLDSNEVIFSRLCSGECFL